AAVRNIQVQDLNATMLLARIRAAAEELRQAELQLVYATDSSTVASPGARVTNAVTALRTLSDSLVAYGLEGPRSEVAATLDRIDTALVAELDAVRHGKGVRADSLSKLLQPVMVRVDSTAERTGAYLQARTADKVEQANVEAASAQRLTTTAFALAVVLAG